jgi:Ca-activated chloride channel family protein
MEKWLDRGERIKLMNDVQIGELNQLHWLWLVASVIVVLLLAALWQRRAARRFASPELIPRFVPGRSPVRRVAAALLCGSTLALLVVCLVDVRWGRVRREIPQRGIEVMFVLDVSRSMQAQDVPPNRLGRGKQMIKDMLDEMAGDRVGLVLFAGEARQKIPMTSHYDEFKQTLDEVGPHDLHRGGSRLGEAIKVAADSFLSRTSDHKAIVLLTDGEDQESDPVAAAREAKQQHGVRIFAIGLGDVAQGARIPIQSSDRLDYLQHQGQQVWSKLDGETLTRIAAETGGAYIPAGVKQVNMAEVYHGYVASVDSTEFDSALVDSFEARFQWFLFPALLLLLCEIAMEIWPQRGSGARPG